VPQSVYPTLRYRDARAAIDWLERAFGAERKEVHDGPDGTVGHAELRLGDDLIMLGTAVEDSDYGRIAPPPGHASLYVAVEDADAHHARAVAAGADVVRPLEDTDYGSRDYAARDPEGNLWSFGTYRPA
jgi:uncharacterized glyoxalase superfamily protein PhnB